LPPPDPDERPYGRRAFLLLLVGGISALGWASPAWRAVSHALGPAADLLPGAIRMYVSLILLLGHLYLAVIHPTTRHALRGITLGTVEEQWATRHHPKWIERRRT